jgi:hypothetical protein
MRQCNRHALGVAAPAIQLFIWLTRTHTNRAAYLEPAAQKTVRRAAANGQTADRLTVRGRRTEMKRFALQDLTPARAMLACERTRTGLPTSSLRLRRQSGAQQRTGRPQIALPFAAVAQR